MVVKSVSIAVMRIRTLLVLPANPVGKFFNLIVRHLFPLLALLFSLQHAEKTDTYLPEGTLWLAPPLSPAPKQTGKLLSQGDNYPPECLQAYSPATKS